MKMNLMAKNLVFKGMYMKKLLCAAAFVIVLGQTSTMLIGAAEKQNAEPTKKELWENFKKLYGGFSQQDKERTLNYLKIWNTLISNIDNTKTMSSMNEKVIANKLGEQTIDIGLMMQKSRNEFPEGNKINYMVSTMAGTNARSNNIIEKIELQRTILKLLKYVMQDLEKAASTTKPAGGPAMESAAGE